MPSTWYVYSGIAGEEDNDTFGRDVAVGTPGSDSNSGLSPSAPFLTLSKLLSVMQNGDTAYLAGRFRTADATLVALALSNAVGRSFLAWAGKPEPDFRGDNVIPLATSWTENLDGSYSALGVLPPGLGTGFGNTLAACMYDYDIEENRDPEGRRVGHLKRVANKAACSTLGTYFYDNNTGEITVHVKFHADPTGSVQIHYSRRGRNCFVNTNTGNASGNLTFTGLRFTGWADGTPQKGCCIMVPGCTGNRYNNCIFDDFGFHAITHNQGTDVDNIDTDCIYRGMPPGAYAIAFYADVSGGGTPVPVTGCKSIRPTFYLNTFVGLDSVTGDFGGSIEQGTEIGGVVCHGLLSSGGDAVKIINPRSIGYTFTDGSPPDISYPYTVTGSGVPPSLDKDDYNTFAVQVIQTDPDIEIIKNGVAMLSSCEIAYVNCKASLTQFGSNGALHALGDFFPNITSPANSCFLLHGCDIRLKQDKLTGPTAAFNIGKNMLVNIKNSSILDISSATGAGVAASKAMFDFSDNTGSPGRLKARKSIFAFRTPTAAGNDERRFLTNDNSSGGSDVNVPDANVDVKDCMVFGVTAGKYSAITAGGAGYSARNTSALWFTMVDPNGFELTMQPFADVTGGLLNLRTFGVAWDARKFTEDDILADGDGVANDGGYGCYFYAREVANVNVASIAGVTAPSPFSYIPRVGFLRNSAEDCYSVVWYRNGYLPAGQGVPIAGTPTLKVVSCVDGSVLLPQTNLVQVDTDVWKLVTSTQVSFGVPAFAEVRAVIEGVTRVFKEPVGRDR